MFEGAKVASVNTMNLDGKKKRRGMTVGKTAAAKKSLATAIFKILSLNTTRSVAACEFVNFVFRNHVVVSDD